MNVYSVTAYNSDMDDYSIFESQMFDSIEKAKDNAIEQVLKSDDGHGWYGIEFNGEVYEKGILPDDWKEHIDITGSEIFSIGYYNPVTKYYESEFVVCKHQIN